MIFTAAVEGLSDEIVLRRIVEHLGHFLGLVHGRHGKQSLLRNLRGYNHAARFEPWIVLIDLDHEACVVTSVNKWLVDPTPMVCLRAAVREVESWLLADSERFASYFAVATKHIPSNPDSLPNPKERLIDVVKHSRRKQMREDVVPDRRLGQSVGPAYTARLTEFAASPDGWRPDAASIASPSLSRAVEAIRRLGSKQVDISYNGRS